MYIGILAGELTRSTFSAFEQSHTLAVRFAVVLTAAVLFLFLWMLVFHVITAGRYKKMDRFKAMIRNICENAKTDPNQKAKEILPPVNELMGKANIGTLNELLADLDEESKKALIALLKQLDCTPFVSNGLNEKYNDEYLIDLIRIAGELGITSLANKITSLIKSNKNNIDIVFEALLALARMNNSNAFIQICMDKRYIKNLSFRNLQEIIAVFTGNKEALYRKLLSAPDDYIIRICIKRIGAEEIYTLLPKTVQFLENKNNNLIIDALRTVGILKYKPAAEKIQKLLKHDHWEVRNAVVQAAAAIDTDQFTDLLIAALQDSEWFVRYNAGLALCNAADYQMIHDKVQATKDKFAIEMLEYMSAMSEISGVKS